MCFKHADRSLAYADGFVLDLAMESTDSVLVTADFGFKVVEDLAKIEFLSRNKLTAERNTPFFDQY